MSSKGRVKKSLPKSAKKYRNKKHLLKGVVSRERKSSEDAVEEESIIDDVCTKEMEMTVEEIPCEESNSSEEEFDGVADSSAWSESDPYVRHFGLEMSEPSPLSYVTREHKWKEIEFTLNVPTLHDSSPSGDEIQRTTLEDLHLKQNLHDSCKSLGFLGDNRLQLEFANMLAEYIDVLYTKWTHETGDALRMAYAVHILNHVLKTQARILHHNSKLTKNPDEEFRDQGFTRPVAVILVPFRHDCYRIVNCLISLLPGCTIMYKKRFKEEYGPESDAPQQFKNKPQDFAHTFEGNINEDFKIGLRVKNRSVRLYAEFYSSNVIIASPLGLRQIVGAEGDRARDFDFLSSVEVLVMDRADVLLLQNPKHLLHVLQHFNRLPERAHGCNFFRVRMSSLDGQARFFRQTVLLSAVEHPWFEAVLFRKVCCNHEGYAVTWSKVQSPAIRQVLVPMQMCFRWFEVDSPETEMDHRFDFFVSKVLPDFLDSMMAQTLVYIPSYFDFVRLRNHFRAHSLSCVALCEYSSPGKVAQARDLFFKGHRHFLLYTERTHFYSRHHIKGIQHLLFYQLPSYPAFLSEMCNLLVDSNPRRRYEEKRCTALACRQDLLQLKHAVGMREARHMHNSKKDVFVSYIGQGDKH